MKKLFLLILALVCVLGLAGCGNSDELENETESKMVGDQLPKGITLMILVNGKNYHWTGLAALPGGC